MACQLTTEQRAELTAYLKSAKAAYHRIMVGGQARVVVDQNGERVEYSVANITRLAQYINSLETQLGLCLTTFGGSSRPTKVWMGCS